MRFLWGREERMGKETATAACLMYLPRREAAGGGDPEALHSAWAEEPTKTWDTQNACVLGILLFPAPAHRTGSDVTHVSHVLGGNLAHLLYWPRLESQPIGLSSLDLPQRPHLAPPFCPQALFACQSLLKNTWRQAALLLGLFVLLRPRKISLLLPQNR